jgi:hypothetical protein
MPELRTDRQAEVDVIFELFRRFRPNAVLYENGLFHLL